MPEENPDAISTAPSVQDGATGGTGRSDEMAGMQRQIDALTNAMEAINNKTAYAQAPGGGPSRKRRTSTGGTNVGSGANVDSLFNPSFQGIQAPSLVEPPPRPPRPAIEQEVRLSSMHDCTFYGNDPMTGKPITDKLGAVPAEEFLEFFKKRANDGRWPPSETLRKMRDALKGKAAEWRDKATAVYLRPEVYYAMSTDLDTFIREFKDHFLGTAATGTDDLNFPTFTQDHKEPWLSFATRVMVAAATAANEWPTPPPNVEFLPDGSAPRSTKTDYYNYAKTIHEEVRNFMALEAVKRGTNDAEIRREINYVILANGNFRDVLKRIRKYEQEHLRKAAPFTSTTPSAANQKNNNQNSGQNPTNGTGRGRGNGQRQNQRPGNRNGQQQKKGNNGHNGTNKQGVHAYEDAGGDYEYDYGYDGDGEEVMANSNGVKCHICDSPDHKVLQCPHLAKARTAAGRTNTSTNNSNRGRGANNNSGSQRPPARRNQPQTATNASIEDAAPQSSYPDQPYSIYNSPNPFYTLGTNFQ